MARTLKWKQEGKNKWIAEPILLPSKNELFAEITVSRIPMDDSYYVNGKLYESYYIESADFYSLKKVHIDRTYTVKRHRTALKKVNELIRLMHSKINR